MSSASSPSSIAKVSGFTGTWLCTMTAARGLKMAAGIWRRLWFQNSAARNGETEGHERVSLHRGQFGEILTGEVVGVARAPDVKASRRKPRLCRLHRVVWKRDSVRKNHFHHGL